MQVQTNPTFYQSFGSINFIEEDIRKINFDSLVSETLGCRSLLVGFSYGNLLKIFFTTSLLEEALDGSIF